MYLVEAICCAPEVTWIEEVHGSYSYKDPREDQVFGYEALVLEECL